MISPARLVDSWRRIAASNFARSVIETFGTRLLLIAVGLVTGVLITRALGPEGRGLYATALAVGAIGVQFGNLGLHASNTYFVARDHTLLPALMGNTLAAGLGLGSAGAVLAWWFFQSWPALAPVHGLLLALALLSIPLGLTYLLLQNLLLGIQSVRAFNAVELTVRLSSVAILAVVIWLQIVTPERILMVSLSTVMLGILLDHWRLRRRRAGSIILSRSLFQQGIHYGFKAYLAAFFAYLVLRVDLLMVKQMLGAEQAGYYSLAANMADLVNLLPVTLGTLLFPKLAAMTDVLQRWRYVRQIAFGVAGLMVGVSLLAVFFVEPMVNFLYGAAFLPAVPAFIWLLPAIVALSVNTIFMNYFAASGMPMISVYSPALAASANVLLNWWLLPQLGIRGASLSSVIAYALMLLCSILYLRWRKLDSVTEERIDG